MRVKAACATFESGAWLARLQGKKKRPLFEPITLRHAELALEIPKQLHQFILLLGIGLLRPFYVNCVLKGGGGKREERWSSEESTAGDGSRTLTELADWHSPLEVLLEEIVDPSRSAEPAIPKDDKSDYRPEGDEAPNGCRNPIHGLFASRTYWKRPAEHCRQDEAFHLSPRCDQLTRSRPYA